jgi:hypothetical protein
MAFFNPTKGTYLAICSTTKLKDALHGLTLDIQCLMGFGPALR